MEKAHYSKSKFFEKELLDQFQVNVSFPPLPNSPPTPQRRLE